MKVLQASCSDSTWKQYLNVFNKWQTYRQSCGPQFSLKIETVVEFLFMLYEEGKGYSCINTARSALSILLGRFDDYAVGNHPLVTRFMKGIGRLRPPSCKYSLVWDPSNVLLVIASWGCNESLNLKNLSKKLAALLALCSAQRVQTLSAIRRNDIHFVSKDMVQIFIKSRLKTTKPGQAHVMHFSKYHDDKLCLLTCLQHYLSVTGGVPATENLFVSTKLPYKSVSSQTIGNWLRSVLQIAGIDTTVFKSHSFRHASTSKALKEGVHIDEIYKSAGWSEKSRVFASFYKRPIVSCNDFMSRLLSSCKK
ncbi:unnamed protein product [Orchesella dallaii]|uniref:Tyr recombinase domain-containing protein n=1 Tax=Orchesella dallaii TaxID=48710 RepID=A0ABP1Q4T4_9HEXA